VKIYLIGSLRTPAVPELAIRLRKHGFDVFDDWHGAGPEADDKWQEYEMRRGRHYSEALYAPAATNVFEFDLRHIDESDVGVLALPAGKSGHLELGHMSGKGKPTFIYFPDGHPKSRPEAWRWLTGLYEGEGSVTRNGKRNGHGMQLTITMKDEDIIRRAHAIAGVGTVEGPYTRDNPNWSDMWRWAVRKREDILYVLRGMWDDLGDRRRDQAVRVLTAAECIEDFGSEDGPYESRWDVMYRFATRVVFSEDELVHWLRKTELEHGY